MARHGLTTHPKFRRLMHRLQLPVPYALGLLECLWSVAYDRCDSEIGDAVDVELAAQWPGEPGKLASALVECRLLDDANGILHIHDLFDHAPDYVVRRAERENGRKAKGKSISDVRRQAANARWAKEKEGVADANDMQLNATENHLHTAGMQKSQLPGQAQPSHNTVSAVSSTNAGNLGKPKREQVELELHPLDSAIPQGQGDRKLLSGLAWLLAAGADIRPALQEAVEAVRVAKPKPRKPLAYLRTVLENRLTKRTLNFLLAKIPDPMFED